MTFSKLDFVRHGSFRIMPRFLILLFSDSSHGSKRIRRNNSAKKYSSLVGWTTVTRRHPIGICRSRILHAGKSNNRDTISTFVGPTMRGNSAHDNQFSLDRIGPDDIRRLSPHTRTQIYLRPHPARALRRLPHLPGVAAKRQTT